MPKLKHKKEATEFAQKWGWDGVLWDCSRDGCEMYGVALLNASFKNAPLTPPFDNTPRVIAVDENGARWLDPNIGVEGGLGDARGRFIHRYELNG